MNPRGISHIVPAQPPLLVIVTGLPCTGKTALARRLAREIPLPLIAKDDLKENLFESLGWSDREWSIRLGRAAIRLVYQLAEELLRARVSAIVETYFHPDLARVDFQALQARVPFRPLVIECVADGEVLLQRWQARIASGERHPGHVDGTIADGTVRATLLRGRSAPHLELGGDKKVIDTTDFAGIPFTELVEEIRDLL